MKILFIYDEIRLDIPNFTGYYQEGLASLSAAVKLEGHETELLHITRPLTEDEFVQELGQRDFDLIGFSSLTPTFPDVRRLVPIARQHYPDTPILYGGVHPTLDPESAAQVDGITAVCVGEAEEALVELLDRMQSDRDPTEVHNFWFRRNGDVIRNATRPLVTDLDTLPMPDVGLFDFKNLFSTREKMAMLTASRGCPYKCTYCSNHAQQQQYPNKGDYVRFKSVDRTVAEARQRMSLDPEIEIRYLDFSDDILPLRRSWFTEFSQRFPREVGLPFQCNVLLSLLNDRSAKELKDAGCGLLIFGLESGSERMRDLMKRPPVTNDEIVRLSKLLHQYQLHIGTYNMVGLPTETTDEMLETVKLNAAVRPDKMNVFFFQPYPNTDIHRLAVEMGLFQPGRDLYSNWKTGPVLDEKQIPHEQIAFVARFFKLLVFLYQTGPHLLPGFERRLDEMLKRRFFDHPTRMARLTQASERATLLAKRVYVRYVLPIYSRRNRELKGHLSEHLGSLRDGIRKVTRRLGRFAMLARRHGPGFLRHATPRKVANFSYLHLQRLARRTEIKGYPYEIIVDPNNYCNLRCPLCPTGQHLNQRGYGELPFDRFTKLMGEVSPFLFKVRFYNWGEPLLHKSIYDMVRFAADQNVSTEISSNLSHKFKDEDADRMIRSGLERLIVSLDGASPETYRMYRVGGEFDKVVRNIETISRRKRELGSRFPEIEIQFIVMRHNEHETEAIRDLGKRIGADRVRLVPVVVNAADEEQRERWLPSDESLSRYDQGQDKIFGSQPYCSWPWRSAVVNWDGSVSACCIFEGPKTEMGNVFEDGGFRAVWDGPAYRAARAVFTKHGADDALRVANGNGNGNGNGDGKHYAGAELCAKCRGMPAALETDQSGLY